MSAPLGSRLPPGWSKISAVPEAGAYCWQVVARRAP
nr:MAG TPA: hypothetical protein [Inoviridae sp.]